MKTDCTFAACDTKLWRIRWSNSDDIKKKKTSQDSFIFPHSSWWHFCSRVHRYLHSILFFVSMLPFWSCFYCEEYRNCAHTAVAAIIRDKTSVLMVWSGLKYSDISGICPPELYFWHFKAAFIQSCRMHEYRKGEKSDSFFMLLGCNSRNSDSWPSYFSNPDDTLLYISDLLISKYKYLNSKNVL